MAVTRHVCDVDVAYSDYRLNLTDITSDVVSGPIGDKATSALWQLSLALVFKMIVTVFTFGIKVRHVKGRALVIAPQVDTATTEAPRYMVRTKQCCTYLH